MILGLDISTSITGATVLSEDGNIVLNVSWDTRKYKDIFEKARFVQEQLQEMRTAHKIEHVFIEQSLQSFRSGFSSAKTLSTLSRFNGIVSWMVFNIFSIKPEYISASSARKSCGIKVLRGENAKQKIVSFLLDSEPKFVVEYTKYGNFKPEVFDRADSLIIARAGVNCLGKSKK